MVALDPDTDRQMDRDQGTDHCSHAQWMKWNTLQLCCTTNLTHENGNVCNQTCATRAKQRTQCGCLSAERSLVFQLFYISENFHSREQRSGRKTWRGRSEPDHCGKVTLTHRQRTENRQRAFLVNTHTHRTVDGVLMHVSRTPLTTTERGSIRRQTAEGRRHPHTPPFSKCWPTQLSPSINRLGSKKLYSLIQQPHLPPQTHKHFTTL